MNDDQAEQLEQPALIGVAEVLTEHAKGTREGAWWRWLESYAPAGDWPGPRQRDAEEAFTAGWRAALEWYIGLGLEQHLRDAIEEAYQQGRAEVHRERRER